MYVSRTMSNWILIPHLTHKLYTMKTIVREVYYPAHINNVCLTHYVKLDTNTAPNT